MLHHERVFALREKLFTLDKRNRIFSCDDLPFLQFICCQPLLNFLSCIPKLRLRHCSGAFSFFALRKNVLQLVK